MIQSQTTLNFEQENEKKKDVELVDISEEKKNDLNLQKKGKIYFKPPKLVEFGTLVWLTFFLFLLVSSIFLVAAFFAFFYSSAFLFDYVFLSGPEYRNTYCKFQNPSSFTVEFDCNSNNNLTINQILIPNNFWSAVTLLY